MSRGAGSSRLRANWWRSRAQPGTGPNQTGSRGPGARTLQPAAAPLSSCYNESRSGVTKAVGLSTCGRHGSAVKLLNLLFGAIASD
jgi:hypothetical protein